MTEKLLARLRSRPLAGVRLSGAYLGSRERALARTRALLATFAEHGVATLVELPGLRTPEDVAAAEALLEEARANVPASPAALPSAPP